MNKKYLKSLLSFILTIGLIAPAVVLGNSTTIFGGESRSDPRIGDHFFREWDSFRGGSGRCQSKDGGILHEQPDALAA